MWEWGSFPQPSPVKLTFSKSGRENPTYASGSGPSGLWRSLAAKTVQVKAGRLGGMRLPVLQDSDEEDAGEERRGRSLVDKEHGRSHSVPAHLQSSDPSSGKQHKRERRKWKEYEDFKEEEEDAMSKASRYQEEAGSLSASRGDPTKFILSIEGQKVGFQLSLAGTEARTLESFKQNLVQFDSFLDDPSIVSHPDLLIRWVGTDQYVLWISLYAYSSEFIHRYVSRDDSPQFFESLVQWRTDALQRRAAGQPLRPLSPSSDESLPTSPTLETPPPETAQHDKLTHMRAKSEPPEESKQTTNAEPTASQTSSSSSWVPWWGRGKKRDTTRPTQQSPTPQAAQDLAPSAPEPSVHHQPDTVNKAVENALVHEVHRTESGQTAKPAKPTRYAKTLRLTSEQLVCPHYPQSRILDLTCPQKSLGLQPGANTITFSLSATGAVACTARIFVWDHTDLVVVSDIDGTITKSDALGHVFAMVGRDWTHMGVAKLYTDIVKNGYKIMYLTSRAIGQADATRGYLKGIKQDDYQLPEGPVIMSPDRLMASLHR